MIEKLEVVMLKEKFKRVLEKQFLDSDIKIFTDNDKYFNIVIISDLFKSKTLVERQKMIYNVIGEYITTRQVHAVSLKTYTKSEWVNVNI